MTGATTCQPPIRETAAPALALPAGACDAHCHVFGPARRYPYHPDRSYTPPDAPAADLARLHGVLGLDRAAIVQATCHGSDNTAMLDAVASAPDRYCGVAMVDARYTGRDYEALHKGGVRGVRLSFARHLSGPPDFDRARGIAERIRPLGWHLELYLEAEDVLAHAGEIERLRLPVVIDHMARVRAADGTGQPAFRRLLRLLASAEIWVKVSCAERLSAVGPPYEDVVPFARALIDAAPDRVLWGTDWPHPNLAGPMPNDGHLVDLLARFAPDPETLRRIVVDNPARLYGFAA